MKSYFTRYSQQYIDSLLYMLQNTEYQLKHYFAWYHRTSDFSRVMKRRGLDRTAKIRLLGKTLWALEALLALFVTLLAVLSVTTGAVIHLALAVILFLLIPYILAYGVAVPLFLGRLLIQLPQERKMIRSARKIFREHPAKKIAIVGSYGKTTVKEILGSILGQSLNVAVTPGNMNTPIGISRFARKLKGDEDILVVEFGEEQVGDVWRLSYLVRPTMAVITGINEAHLSSFKSLKQTTETIFEIKEYLNPSAIIYKNGENETVSKHVSKKDPYIYSRTGVNGWKVSDARVSLEHGTSFIVKKADKNIHVKTELIGLHNIGPLIAAISIADGLGLSVKNIEAGLKKVKPFEHRMQPRMLHGAWVIDDTYNGNSDGVAAGLALLKKTKAKRRIYVTPGLVETGMRTEEVHKLIGTQIAGSADFVVLMRNSVTDYIVEGLKSKKFKGELMIIDNPLDFYTNIEHFVAAGDVVLMQNDWTDNYR